MEFNYMKRKKKQLLVSGTLATPITVSETWINFVRKCDNGLSKKQKKLISRKCHKMEKEERKIHLDAGGREKTRKLVTFSTIVVAVIIFYHYYNPEISPNETEREKL